MVIPSFLWATWSNAKKQMHQFTRGNSSTSHSPLKNTQANTNIHYRYQTPVQLFLPVLLLENILWEQYGGEVVEL